MAKQRKAELKQFSIAWNEGESKKERGRVKKAKSPIIVAENAQNVEKKESGFDNRHRRTRRRWVRPEIIKCRYVDAVNTRDCITTCSLLSFILNQRGVYVFFLYPNSHPFAAFLNLYRFHSVVILFVRLTFYVFGVCFPLFLALPFHIAAI